MPPIELIMYIYNNIIYLCGIGTYIYACDYFHAIHTYYNICSWIMSGKKIYNLRISLFLTVIIIYSKYFSPSPKADDS